MPEQVAPEYCNLDCNGNTIEAIIVDIGGKEFEMCEKVKMWSSSKTDDWGKTTMNTFEDNNKAERTGKLGEMAFGKITNSPVDFTYKKYGDDMDACFMGHKINVKCQRSLYGLWVRCEERGHKITLNEDLFVFTYLEFEDRLKKNAVVYLLGCTPKYEVIRWKIEQRRGHDWKNYVGSYSQLFPMRRLLDLSKRCNSSKI